jgi:hypothetical protein
MYLAASVWASAVINECCQNLTKLVNVIRQQLLNIWSVMFTQRRSRVNAYSFWKSTENS